MAKVIFNQERCKGCELCTTVCPNKLITLSKNINKNGFHPAFVENQEKCTGCSLCAVICPDMAIEIEKGEK